MRSTAGIIGQRGRALTVLVCTAVLALAPSLVAQSEPDELARRHFESGAAYFEEADYPNALAAFEKSYELSKRPEVLLNIATVHERKGDLRAAVETLEKFLTEKPDDAGADTIRRRIENLKARVVDTPPPAVDAGAHTEDAAPVPVPMTSATAPAPVPPPAPEDEQPGANVPALILLSVGGLSTAGAIVTGVLAQSEHADLEKSCAPNCTDDDVSGGKTLALTSTILTGVAVVSVGVGLALLLTGSSDTAPAREASLVPRLKVGVEPRGAAAEATWQF